MELFHAYAAGFFDGEGSVCITRAQMAQYSVSHRLIIDVAQRTDQAGVLYELQAAFGGQVTQRKQTGASFTPGARISNWHLQKREDVERFLRAILPMLRVKRAQAELALEFIAATPYVSRAIRTGGASGQRFYAGTARLTDDQLALREEFRLRMRELNQRRGPETATG